MTNISVGSVCSGIEAASLAWQNLGFSFKWFSEISKFPSQILQDKYPLIPNLGDMNSIPELIKNEKIESPDLICGGTPCQAFSLAGWKKGLVDSRGHLTLKFVEIIENNDKIRIKNKKFPSFVLWENVEGVLKDKTNAFGIFVSLLAGLNKEIVLKAWPKAGLLRGPKRNVAWRVLDAKFFGLPQQRKRVYVLSLNKDLHPENVMFDNFPQVSLSEMYADIPLVFQKNEFVIEVFRAYTDCLYSAYGTKWNGNAAAYNGSLFVCQNERLRRLTPLECERLMGFPDNYTKLPKSKSTNRYQSLGNSWSVPVIKWLGDRISKTNLNKKNTYFTSKKLTKNYEFFDISNENVGSEINGSEIPENPAIGNLLDIIDTSAEENFYISPVGCSGIIRRANERKININKKLHIYLDKISALWPESKIQSVSMLQSRAKFNCGELNDYIK